MLVIRPQLMYANNNRTNLVQIIIIKNRVYNFISKVFHIFVMVLFYYILAADELSNMKLSK